MLAVQFVRRRCFRLQPGFSVAVVHQAIYKQAVAYQISHGSSGHREMGSLSAGEISSTGSITLKKESRKQDSFEINPHQRSLINTISTLLKIELYNSQNTRQNSSMSAPL